MNRAQLAHILRSASRIAEDSAVLVVGSQSILGSHDEDDLPAEATASMEADIAFLDDADRAKADQVNPMTLSHPSSPPVAQKIWTSR